MKMNRVKKALRKNLLLLLTLVGVVVGLLIGFAVRPFHPSEDALMWLGLPGQLYLRMLKMMIVPLIITSVITGTASLDAKANGKVGAVAFVFIFVTNTIGSVLGVLAFVIFKPGTLEEAFHADAGAIKTVPLGTQDIFSDLIRNIFPDNLFEATFRQTQTKYTPVKSELERGRNSSNMTGSTVQEYTKSLGIAGGANLLGLILACTLFGIAAAGLKEKGRPIIEFFKSSSLAVLAVMRWFMWATPVGVTSLILVSVADISNIEDVFRGLGVFIGAVTVGLLVQQLLVMPAILFVTTRRNPYAHLFAISRAWLIAFATASSAVAMPEMMNSCERELHVDKRVSRFVIPLGVTISANGSAVFIACSCLFASNLTGAYPSPELIVIIGLLAAVTSLAIPSVPSSSIVTIVMILSTLGIPPDSIALLLTVEFYLDRLRTTSSVVSHTMAATVTFHICKRSLGNQDDGVEFVEIVVDKEDAQTKLPSSTKDGKSPGEKDVFL